MRRWKSSEPLAICNSGIRGWLLVALAAAAAAGAPGAAQQDPRRSSVAHEVASGPTRAFELTAHRTPRLLFVGRNRRVQLELVNRGTMTWSPERGFAVSYAWLGRGDEKLEGGRALRTPLPGRVAAGETVRVEAKLRPPQRPGLYVLQWDVVQERVQWFSDGVLHPRFRQRVLVLPRPEHWLAVALPTLLALAGLAGSLGRLDPSGAARGIGSWLARAFLASAAVWWCAASLFGKPQLLYLEMELRPSAAAGWWTLAAVAGVVALLLALPRWLRGPAAWLVAAAAALWVWGHILHYRFFREVISVTALPAAGQTGQLGESIRHLARSSDWLLVADLAAALPLVWWAQRRRGAPPAGRGRLRAVGVVLLALVAAGSLGQLWQLSDWTAGGRRGPRVRTVRTIKSHGLYGFQAQDVLSEIRRRWLKPPLAPGEVEAIEDWLIERAPLRAGAGTLFGIAEDRNLIAIQVESMQQFVLGLRVEGVEVTPSLNRLEGEALRFSAVQDQTGSGRSAAGEFVAWTSIVPVASSVAHEYAANHFTTLAHVLAGRGYQVISAMPFVRSFWNRHRTYPAFGFSQGLWNRDFERGERVGWGLSDLDFLRQMAPRIDRLPPPFCLWLTTLSLHYPYETFPEELKVLDLGPLEGTAFGNYLHGMNLFDRALGELMTSLQRSGRLEDTVVVLWGDHDSGLVRREESPEPLGVDTAWPEYFLWDRVPFVIWLPGEGSPRGQLDTWAGQVDIAPTLLALFGEDPARFALVGRNLLGDPLPRQAIVHPNGNWTDGELMFFDPGEDLEAGSCWSLARRRRIAAKWCRAGYDEAQRQLEVSQTLLVYDLQQTLTERLGTRLAGPEPLGR